MSAPLFSSQLPESVLFDLDGTLLDTAPDMGLALNLQLEKHGRAPLSEEVIRPLVSHGAIGLLNLGFGLSLESPEFEDMRREYLDIYADNLAVGTCLFEGMESLLSELESSDVLWGIVTNKPGFLTDPLLRALSLTERSACVISGDTLKLRKPHPAPLLEACKRINVDPSKTIYVGDAQRDIEAGKRARMKTVAADYGYIPENENSRDWQADAHVGEVAELAALCGLS